MQKGWARFVRAQPFAASSVTTYWTFWREARGNFYQSVPAITSFPERRCLVAGRPDAGGPRPVSHRQRAGATRSSCGFREASFQRAGIGTDCYVLLARSRRAFE